MMNQTPPQLPSQPSSPKKQPQQQQRPKRRKLKPLIITMSPARQSHITSLFTHPTMSPHFHPPTYTPGIPSRDLRNSYKLIQHAGQAGILPPAEWDILRSPETRSVYERDPTQLFNHLAEMLPEVEAGRRGGEFDVKMHYGKELWQKAKSVNRGRAVLACTLAHLKAMRVLVEGGFDFILEDNVRAPIGPCCNGNGEDDDAIVDCARRIYEAMEASLEWQKETGTPCHLRYYGWLGSKPNLEYVVRTHCPKTMYCRKNNTTDGRDISVFPFPINCSTDAADDDDTEEILLDQPSSPPHPNVQQQEQQHQQTQQEQDIENAEEEERNKTQDKKEQGQPHRIAGGTLIWGAYAYWISKEGHEALLSSLQKDVGALLWKGKRMRCHKVKPIDKVLPRRIIAEMEGGSDCVHVATHPAFFRAPMLTSQIHSQWDAEFCKSTEYQMSTPCGVEIECDKSALTWDDLWLSANERSIVQHKKDNGVWLTMSELETMRQSLTP